MNTRKLSNKQEKKIANDLDGKTIPNSGALKVAASWKADVNTETEKIECKITSKDSYQLHFKDIMKLKGYASKDRGKTPVFIVEFQDRESYVILFCTYDEWKECLLHFETKAKSYSMQRKDLYDWSCKSDQLVGIKFETRYIKIIPYVKWRADIKKEKNANNNSN